MSLATTVSESLEKRGVLSTLRAELLSNVFSAIEEQERADGDEDEYWLIGACNSRAKELHSTQEGKLLNGLICEYLEWCSLKRTLKILLPESNIERGLCLSKAELQDELELPNDPSCPLLVKLVEQHLTRLLEKEGGESSGAEEHTMEQHGQQSETSNSSSSDEVRTATSINGLTRSLTF